MRPRGADEIFAEYLRCGDASSRLSHVDRSIDGPATFYRKPGPENVQSA